MKAFANFDPQGLTQPRDIEWLSHEDDRLIGEETAQRRNAIRQLILNGDEKSIQACLMDWADDYASDFFRDVVGLVKADLPSDEAAAMRYWQIRTACEKFLSRYLEATIDEAAVEAEMRSEGIL